MSVHTLNFRLCKCKRELSGSFVRAHIEGLVEDHSVPLAECLPQLLHQLWAFLAANLLMNERNWYI